jgi:myosin heavy subunit
VRSTRRIGSGLGKVTLGGEFKKQLVSLMDTLNSTEPHFVRCMKPNMEKVGKKFDSHVMLSQLRYAGLVEVCRIRQLGFPYRMVFQRFLSLYTLLAPNGGGSPQQLLGAIVEKGILTPDEFAIGTTKVFLKHLSLQKLNAGRDSALKGVVASIQKIIRGKLMRLRFANMKKILSNLQTAMQNSTGSVNVQQLEEALANSVELPHQGAHFPLVKEGRSLFRKVNEEIKIKALLEEAMSNRVMKALEAAIDTANSLQKPHKLQGLADVIKKAMASVNDMKRDKIHLDKVPALIKSGNLEDLQQWMEVAVQLNLGNTDGARSIEVIIARVCDERDVMDELVIAADAKDLPTLSAVLIRVAEMGLENAVVTKAKKTQQVLESINTGLTALTTALETRHLQSIKDGVNKAKECGVTSDNSLLKKATYVVDMMESVAFVESKLKVALNGQNIDELTKLIAQGEQALTLAKEHNFEVEIVSMSSAISLVDALNRQLKVIILMLI